MKETIIYDDKMLKNFLKKLMSTMGLVAGIGGVICLLREQPPIISSIQP